MWVGVLAFTLAAVGIIIYRRNKAAQNTTATDTAGTAAGSPTSQVDWSGEISTLQTEIADLQSSEAAATAAANKQAQAEQGQIAEQEQDIGQAAAAERKEDKPKPKPKPKPKRKVTQPRRLPVEHPRVAGQHNRRRAA
jgi:DNA-binding protein H-NS